MNNIKQKTRKQIRLKSYDYTSPGMYFITICTQNRECLFGEIINGEMVLNDIGTMINKIIFEMNQYDHINIDTHMVMPNHIHMIMQITNNNPVGVNPRVDPSFDPRVDPHDNGQAQRPAPTVGEYVKRFKTRATYKYIRNVKNNHWKPFNKRLFQRNFYEHIIRADGDLEKIRAYIQNNPQMWERDRNNVAII